MIRRLKYNQIDFEKYSRCLENSQQRKYSASKEFLDITSARKWELLILNDYEAIMPVPFVRKMGFKFVVNPKLCQQLGVFSEIDNEEINNQFLKFFIDKYRIWYYGFNDVNQFTTNLSRRKNYLIHPENYDVVRQRYSPKRKRKLRLDPEVLDNSKIETINFAEAERFISENSLGAKNEDDKKEFLKILSQLEKANLLEVIIFKYKSKIINALAIFTNSETVALLGTFNDKNNVKLSGSSVLIDHVISKNIDTKIFDFEGSEIPAIEEFFTGFRPQLQTYPVIKNSKEAVLKKFLGLQS